MSHTIPTTAREGDLRAALVQERAELQAANDAAPGWGAAVGARAERIRAIDRALAAPPPAQDPVPALGLPAGEIEGLRALDAEIDHAWAIYSVARYSKEQPERDAWVSAVKNFDAAAIDYVRTHVLAPPASATDGDGLRYPTPSNCAERVMKILQDLLNNGPYDFDGVSTYAAANSAALKIYEATGVLKDPTPPPVPTTRVAGLDRASHCEKLETLLFDVPVLVVDRAAARAAGDTATLAYADAIHVWKLRYDAVMACRAVESSGDRNTVSVEDAEKEANESYEIGVRDGIDEGVQKVARAFGLDGEYRCSPAPDRHVPDHQTMIEQIVEHAGALAQQTPAAGLDRSATDTLARLTDAALLGAYYDCDSAERDRPEAEFLADIRRDYTEHVDTAEAIARRSLKILAPTPGETPGQDAVVAALKPFAEAADDLDDKAADGGHLWESPAAMGLTAGDLRAARAALTEEPPHAAE